MKKIDFSLFVGICETYIDNPQDEKIATAFQDLQTSLIIRSYMPMQEKVILLYRIITDSDKELDLPAAAFTAGFELACLFDGLLAYTNVDTNISLKDKTYEKYDIIYQSGIADYILQFCKLDYERFVNMAERILSYGHLADLIETLDGLDTDYIQEALQEFKDMKKNIDSKTIENLATIAYFEDPSLYKLREELQDNALENFDNVK